MYSMFTDLIQTNIDELETRDIDQFYSCTKENAEDSLGRKLTSEECEELYAECHSMLNAEREPISECDLQRMYCEMLDEVHGTVKVAGYEYETSRVLAEIDPVAFRCGFSDWISFQLEDGIFEEINGEYYLTERN